MTPLKSRQERFCRWFVELANATAAARAAGYAPAHARNAGYRLIRHPRIGKRITEIEAETARVHSPSSEVLVGKLENIYRRAIVDHQFQAAARAIDLQARIRGFTGQVPVSATEQADPESDDRSDGWSGDRSGDRSDMPRAHGGRGSRPTASGDIRRARRDGPGFSDF